MDWTTPAAPHPRSPTAICTAVRLAGVMLKQAKELLCQQPFHHPTHAGKKLTTCIITDFPSRNTEVR